MRYSIHINEICNLKCHYCYEDNQSGYRITKEEVDQKIEYIKSFGNCDSIELLGGEPFLDVDIIEYVLAKYSDMFQFVITTNGTIRNERIDRLIKEYTPGISVSLDDPMTVETFRRGLNLNDAIDNAKAWREYVPVVIGAVLHPHNIKRIKETYDFYIQEQGFGYIHFGCVEEWMTDYWWECYNIEVKRFIDTTDPVLLREYPASPWNDYRPFKKESIYEEGQYKMEIFHPAEGKKSKYSQVATELSNYYKERVSL